MDGLEFEFFDVARGPHRIASPLPCGDVGEIVVVALRFYRDLTVQDIASRLGVPAGTVQSRLHYALKRLHDVIEPADTKGMVR